MLCGSNLALAVSGLTYANGFEAGYQRGKAGKALVWNSQACFLLEGGTWLYIGTVVLF